MMYSVIEHDTVKRPLNRNLLDHVFFLCIFFYSPTNHRKAKRKRPPPHASIQSKLSSQVSFPSFYKLTSKDTAQTDKR